MLKEGVIGINRAPPMGWRATSSGSPAMQDHCRSDVLAHPPNELREPL